MRSTAALFIAPVLGAFLFTATATAQETERRRARDEAFDRQDRTRQDQQQTQAPEGYVLVSERIILLMADQPQQHFIRAKRHLNQENPEAAAAEIRLAAAYLDLQSSRAQGQARQQLSQQTDELNSLADRVERGRDISSDQLDQPFARASHALARHHQTLAQNALDDKRPVKAGYELRSGAMSLQRALAWSDQPLQGDVRSAVVDARRQASQLISGQRMVEGRRTEEFDRTGEMAQPAAARVGEQDLRQQGEIPREASSTVKELGSVIEQVGQDIRPGSERPGRIQQQQRPGQQY